MYLLVDGAEITTRTTIIAIIFMTIIATMYQLRKAGVFKVVVVWGRWWGGGGNGRGGGGGGGGFVASKETTTTTMGGSVGVG